jgi:ferredoxin-NADP reductase
MHEYKVAEISNVTPSVALLTLQNPDAKFDFSAGQYAALHFKSHGRPSPVRCFSIVSPSQEQTRLQFAFRVTGNYSYRLSQLRPGESVYVQGPFGDFTVNPQYDRSLIFIAGGIGITPFLSMLLSLTKMRLNIPITLLYACRDENDVPFADQLKQLQRQNPNLKVIFVLGKTPTSARFANASVVTGKIDEGLVAKVYSQVAADTTYFLCGPPKFMDSLSSALSQQGVHEDRIIMEAFGQRAGTVIKLADKGQRRIYSTTLASIAFGVAILAGGGLMKSAQAHAASLIKDVTAEGSDDGTASSDAASSPDTSATNASSPTPAGSPSSTSSTSNTVNTSPSTAQYYQQPMSSVS